jgi:RimK family alpha-L-glutamate ligase
MLIKKVSGSKGKGVVLVNNRDELEDIMGLFEEANIHNPNLIIQEFIAGSRGKDIRVLVIGGKVIGAMLRQAKGGSFKANFSSGGSVEAIELTPAMEWLAIESTRILNLEIAGVDLLFDGDSYQVCEVNAAPGFEGFSKAHPGVNVAREILQYLQVRLGKN